MRGLFRLLGSKPFVWGVPVCLLFFAIGTFVGYRIACFSGTQNSIGASSPERLGDKQARWDPPTRNLSATASGVQNGCSTSGQRTGLSHRKQQPSGKEMDARARPIIPSIIQPSDPFEIFRNFIKPGPASKEALALAYKIRHMEPGEFDGIMTEIRNQLLLDKDKADVDPRVFWDPVLTSLGHFYSDEILEFLFELARDSFIKRRSSGTVCQAISMHASRLNNDSAMAWCLDHVRNAGRVHKEVLNGLNLSHDEVRAAFISALREGRCSPGFKVFVEIGEEAIEPLMDVLFDRNSRFTWDKPKACENLLKIDAGLFGRILDCYYHADSQTRIVILSGLCRSIDVITDRRKELLDFVIKALGDSDARVRDEACGLLPWKWIDLRPDEKVLVIDKLRMVAQWDTDMGVREKANNAIHFFEIKSKNK